MKKTIHKTALIFLLAFLSSFTFMAQVPEGIVYQAEARTQDGKILQNENLEVEVNILQGFADGALVWQGIHEIRTDKYGLITLTIGEGVSSDNFSDIDWAHYAHFLNVRINYKEIWTDLGTTQFISVPYAIHAKTAEHAFSADEIDPVFFYSEAANITSNDITNLGNLSGVNTGDQDLSDLALKSNVLELDNTTEFTPDADYEPATKKYVDDNAGGSAATFTRGDFAQGGVVFWVDETGQHGLVAAKEDQSTGVRWYAGTYGNTQAKGDGPFSGEANTAIIIAAHVAIGDDGSTYAARICNELQITEGDKTYGDWYLTSKEELNLMYQNKSTIDATATSNGGTAFAPSHYWSSTESIYSYPWIQLFNDGRQGWGYKHGAFRVRAVRAF